MRKHGNRVCPATLAASLDSKIRRWIQNPQQILCPFVKEAMTVLDVGCGPGFFSMEMARMVGAGGMVISADLQEAMLDKLRAKIKGTELEQRISVVKCDPDRINVREKADFILTFYMVHEVPEKSGFFKQLKNLLKQNGQYLIVEPKLFHVSKSEFRETLRLAEANGFASAPGPKLLLSWSAVLRHK
jgi:ubiquinone/menaquinone biosynthesis C-methylase UbiE